jgi:hypothetical protein
VYNGGQLDVKLVVKYRVELISPLSKEKKEVQEDAEW